MSALQVSAATGLDAQVCGTLLSRLVADEPALERVSRGRYRLMPNGTAR